MRRQRLSELLNAAECLSLDGGISDEETETGVLFDPDGDLDLDLFLPAYDGLVALPCA